ncbi:MAG: AAA family ATPase [Planctomycetota bacterium]|nr:AAA family ATPase [Planctomycetota bacterium]
MTLSEPKCVIDRAIKLLNEPACQSVAERATSDGSNTADQHGVNCFKLATAVTNRHPWHDDWILRDAYLSPVCLVLRLEFKTPVIADLDRAKQSLKQLVLATMTCALDAGFLLPSIALVELTDEMPRMRRDQVEGWARDQDWHRGEFSVFIANSCEQSSKPASELKIGSLDERLRDLIRPTPTGLPDQLRSPRRTIDVLNDPCVLRAGVSEQLLERLSGVYTEWKGGNRSPDDEGTTSQSKDDDEKQRRQWMRSAVIESVAPAEKLRPGDLTANYRDSTDINFRALNTDRSESSTTDTERFVTRVTEIEVTNFRGFGQRSNGEPHRFNTDADIVLLVGPNGSGKSSLLEALLLALTGQHTIRSAASDSDGNELPAALFTLVDGDAEPAGKSPAETFNIQLAVESSDVRGRSRDMRDHSTEKDADQKQAKISVTANIGDADCKFDFGDSPWPLSVSRRGERYQGNRNDCELDARLCAFFQDHADWLFDENTSGRTLRDVFEPLPRFIRELSLAADNVRSEIVAESERLEHRESAYPPAEQQRIHEAFDEWSLSYATLWEQLQALFDTLGTPPRRTIVAPGRSLNLTSVRDHMRQISGSGSNSLRDLAAAALREAEAILQTADRQIRGRTPSDGSATKSATNSNQRLDELERKLARVRQQLRDVRNELSPLNVEDDENQTDNENDAASRSLLTVLQDLGSNLNRWTRETGRLSQSDGALNELQTELQAVAPKALQQRIAELQAWYRPRRERIESLVRESRDLEEEIKRLRRGVKEVSSEAKQQYAAAARGRKALESRLLLVDRMEALVDWQQDATMRQQRRDELNRVARHLSALKRGLDESTQPSVPLRQALQDAANAVLGRFAMTDGLKRLELTAQDATDERNPDDDRRSYTARGADGDRRGIEHFSTGQRSQIGIALMVAQCEMLQHSTHQPGHRLLLLDDVSTSYDLANLSRETLLWRQLAYHPDPARRRQIFIASHHEDLTNHLLDLLAPPGPRAAFLYAGSTESPQQDGDAAAARRNAAGSLRVLKFVDWKPGSGPVVEQFQVVESPSVSVSVGESRATLTRLLEATL